MSTVPPSRWTLALEETPHAVLDAMRKSGHEDLYRELVNFLRPLPAELGGDVDGNKKLPGLHMGDNRYSLEVRGAPVIVSYIVEPDEFRIRVTDILWMYTG